MNGWNNFDNTDRQYSLALNDDLVRFWRSKVIFTAGHRAGIHVDAGASMFHLLLSILNHLCNTVVPILNNAELSPVFMCSANAENVGVD